MTACEQYLFMSNDKVSRAFGPVSTCPVEKKSHHLLETGTLISLSITELGGFNVGTFVAPQECFIFLVISEAQSRTQQQIGTVCDIFLPVLPLEKRIYFQVYL